MSNKHLKFSYRDNASKLHKTVGDILRSNPYLKNFNSLQEYPIPRTKYHVDWFIPDFKIAIEVHGEQHYKPVCFGGMPELEAQLRFVEQQRRDRTKKALCLANGWKVVEFKYDEVIDEDTVSQRILKAISS